MTGLDDDDWDREAAALHAERGYTIAVYFPPAAPWSVVDAALDRIADLVHGLDRGGWDGHVVGHMGDVLGVDHDPADHAYLSTGCLHGDQVLPDGRTGHQYCRGETGACGTKTPSCCKHCGAPCRCTCHRKTTPGEAPAGAGEEQP